MGGMDDERASLTAALFLATVAFVSIVVGIACGEARTLMVFGIYLFALASVLAAKGDGR